MRGTGKRLVERALRLLPLTPRRMRGRALILAYHNVVPDGLQGWGDGSLHLPISEFVRQVDLLKAHCRLVSLADVLAGDTSATQPVVALTFDDAYRGAVELALPELARREVPCTLFVAPELFGRRQLWWDALAQGQAGLAPAVRRHALEAGEGRHDRLVTERTVAESELPAFYDCADEAAVLALRRFETVTLAAHSWSHPNLTRMSRAELAVEMSRPLDWLRTLDGRMLPVVAYPYGLTSPAVQAAAERAGYSGGLLVEGGWYTRGADTWKIPRYNVPAGLSADGLMLRLTGLIRLAPSGSDVR